MDDVKAKWDAMVAENQVLRAGWLAFIELGKHTDLACGHCCKACGLFTLAVLRGADPRKPETIALRCEQARQWQADMNRALDLL